MSMTEQELLNVLKQAARAGYLGGGGGGGGTGGSTGGSTGTGQFGKELGAAGDALKVLGSATLSVGGKVAEGGARLSDVTQALSAGFAGLGTSGSVLTASLATGTKALNLLGKNLDENIDTWRKLSDTGLAFGNDIMAMKDQASAARLSIAEMSEVMQKNNASMLGFGATSAEGAKKFSKMADTFFTSGLGEQLRGMGYTTKELNDVLAVSISGSKLKDLKDKDGQDRSLKAAASLATEMDAVAKITGQSKQEQLDDLRRKATDGQRMAAIDEAIAKGGVGAKEAFDAISANGKLMGPQFQKLAEDMASMGRPSEGMEQAYGLLSSGAKKLMNEAGEAARGGDRERAAQLTKQAAAEQAAFQNTSQYRTMAAQAGIKETQESYAQGAKFRNALADAGGNINNVEESMKKLDEQVTKEQKAGGKDDPNAAAGASITRFAVDIESRGRDLTKVLNDQVIQPLAKDIGPELAKVSKNLKLGSSTVIQDQIGDPMKKGYDKSRIDRTVEEEAKKSGGAADKNSPLRNDVMAFGALLNGNQKQSDTTLKVLEKMAADQSKATGKTVTAEDVAKNATNTPGAMADIVKQIKAALPADAQLDANKTKKDQKTHVSGDKAKPAAESAGAGIEALGGLFRSASPGFVSIVGTVNVNAKPKAVGGIIEKPELILAGEAGPEAIFNQSQLQDYTAKIMGSAANATPKLLPPPEEGSKPSFAESMAASVKNGMKTVGVDPNMRGDSKIDLSSISKSISTSISSVSGGGSTTTNRVQNDDSKAAEKELKSVKEQYAAERQSLLEKTKTQLGPDASFGTVRKAMREGDDAKALEAKYSTLMDPLNKKIADGISIEVTKKASAVEETTKMVNEQIAITKTSNSTLADMYKDDSKSKLDLAKKTNADAFKEAELAKDVVGTSVKGMSEDMINAMIPKGATIEDYYVDMNDKLQSNSADAVAKMEKIAKEGANTTITEEKAIVEARVAIKKTEKAMAPDTTSLQTAKELPKPATESMLDIKAAMPDMSKTFEGLTAGMPDMFKSMSAGMPDMFKSMSAGMPDMFKSMSAGMPGKSDNQAAKDNEYRNIAGKSSISSAQSSYAESKAARADTESKSELARESRRSTPLDAPKSKMMSTADMMAGGLDIGANGMPIMKSIDTAKNSIPATKSVDADTAREDAKFKRQSEEKKAEAVKMAEKKPDAKAATKESTLSDVVAQLNSLNTQMGQLLAQNEDLGRKQVNATKSNNRNLLAR